MPWSVPELILFEIDAEVFAFWDRLAIARNPLRVYNSMKSWVEKTDALEPTKSEPIEPEPIKPEPIEKMGMVSGTFACFFGLLIVITCIIANRFARQTHQQQKPRRTHQSRAL